MKFKVGDIVRGMKKSPYGITNENMTKGKVVVVGSYGEDADIIVKVLEHKTKPEWIEYTFPVNSKYFELYDYNKIVITTDGNKTLARLYENNEVIRTAEAKCSPEDTFEFETGAKLAFERLMEKKDEFVPYLKSAEEIKDFLAFIGAPKAALKITEIMIEKEVMSNANRQKNCDLANVTKQVDAAEKAIAAIDSLIASGKLDTLNAHLKETALARREFAEDTLQELAERLGITKSCLNHRLRRLTELEREGGNERENR